MAAPPGVTPRRAAAARGGGAIAFAASILDLAWRTALVWLLYAGLVAFAEWAGHEAVHGGAWLEADRSLYRAINGLAIEPVTGVLVSLLNDPGPAYFVVILLLLGYCGWRRRSALPAAALAIGVALALGHMATEAAHHAGTRQRPFVSIEEARTPITDCAAPRLLVMRDADGPTASCEGAPAALVGLDWREIWIQFPSFPSGHLRETTALSLLLVAFWPASWPFAVAYVFVMAFSRVHIGTHFPTDVAGGLIFGLWSGAITLVGLDLLRRAWRTLYQLPPVRFVWDWVAVTRVTGRPDLDPVAARLIRAGVFVVVAFGVLYVLGFTLVTGEAGQLYSVLQNVDYSAFGLITTRFDPSVARALYLALGPANLLYAALAIVALGAAWLHVPHKTSPEKRFFSWGHSPQTPVFRGVSSAGERRGRRTLRTLVALVATVLLAASIQFVGSRWFFRPQPFVQVEEAPIPVEWRIAWEAATSFPNWHVLLVAALAGAALPARWWVALPVHVVALLATFTAVYFGASWATDALASYALGNVVAAVGRYTAQQFTPPP